MKFSETIKNADPDLVVSRQHDAWLESNDHPVYTFEALNFAIDQFRKPPRRRAGTLSASSLGECPRYQQFVFLGMPQLPPDQKNAMKMQNGMFMHLRWQMAGLSAGWLAEAEVPVGDNEFGLMGTMDGICYEDSVLELKSINANGFSRVQTFGPLIPHLYQMATYLLCTERRKGVFVYECKDNQEYKEVVLDRSQLPIDEAVVIAQLMRAELAGKRLYEPLNDCIDRKGWKYNSCPFRDRCLSIHTWEDVG